MSASTRRNERQTYHTDSCDIVGLLCLKTAQSGGLSALVSSTTIFNEMRRRRPDLLKLLFEPVATDRRGEVPEGQKPYFEIPVFNWHEGFLTAIYQRQYIDSAQRFPDAPRLTPAHVEALDLFDALANDPGAQHVHGVQAGRRAARAQPHHAARPHRLRGLARARTPPPSAAPVAGGAGNARPLPEVFAQRYGSGRRSATAAASSCAGTKLNAPLEAV